MNFILSSTTLLKQLQNISGVLTTNHTLPILDNFLFELQDGILTVTATDLETTMRTTVDLIEHKEDVKICIPAKLLLDIIKTLPEQPCTFTINLNELSIEIAYDNGRSRMVGFKSDDFPRNPEIQGANSIVLPGTVLSKAISKTLFATGSDDLRPVMSGVFCSFSPEEVTFVATDAHKLVKYTRTDSVASGSSSFILPKKALNLLKINVKDDGQVKIEYNESNAVFSVNEVVLICRLIDGKYPNYEAVIPRENPNVLVIDRIQFLNSIKRVSIFANKTTHQIRLGLAGSELSLLAEDLDFSNEARERLTCNYDGDDMEIAFNSRFLIEMLSNLDSEEVRLEMSEPSRAGILRPAISEAHEDILMLVMPVMINR